MHIFCLDQRSHVLKASEGKIFIKKKVKKGEARCLDFNGITFNTIQEDLMEWSEWSAWSECEDDQIFRTRECSGIFCDEKTETETKDEPCLKVRNYF